MRFLSYFLQLNGHGGAPNGGSHNGHGRTGAAPGGSSRTTRGGYSGRTSRHRNPLVGENGLSNVQHDVEGPAGHNGARSDEHQPNDSRQPGLADVQRQQDDTQAGQDGIQRPDGEGGDDDDRDDAPGANGTSGHASAAA